MREVFWCRTEGNTRLGKRWEDNIKKYTLKKQWELELD
jgi:hypothetical protein